MSKKNKPLPFIQTHTITFQGKLTMETWPVMAVSDGETTRLYDVECAESGKTPEWRVTTGALPEKQEIVSNGIKFQRNRKDFKGAILRRIEGAPIFWTIENGEMVATPPAPPARDEVVTEEHADGSATSTTVGADEVKVEAKEEEGPEDLKKLLATNVKKPRGTGGGKGGKRGPRAGSVMSMTVPELQAEFTERTKQAAPSNSIHYMRKLVLGARRGQTRVLVRKPRKTPTIALTLEEARELLTGCDWSAGAPAAASKVQLFITSHEAPATEVTPS